MVNLEPQDLLEQLGHRDYKVLEEVRVQQDNRVHWDLPVFRELMVNQARLDQLEL